jgi:hypothetical protein
MTMTTNDPKNAIIAEIRSAREAKDFASIVINYASLHPELRPDILRFTELTAREVTLIETALAFDEARPRLENRALDPNTASAACASLAEMIAAIDGVACCNHGHVRLARGFLFVQFYLGEKMASDDSHMEYDHFEMYADAKWSMAKIDFRPNQEELETAEVEIREGRERPPRRELFERAESAVVAVAEIIANQRNAS